MRIGMLIRRYLFKNAVCEQSWTTHTTVFACQGDLSDVYVCIPRYKSPSCYNFGEFNGWYSIYKVGSLRLKKKEL